MLRSRSLTSIMVCRIRKVMLSTFFSPLICCSLYPWANTMVRKLIPLGRQASRITKPLALFDRRRKRYRLRIFRSMLTDRAIVEVLGSAAAYHFRFFECFISRNTTMKPIRTMGQFLVAHFQNGLSSVDKRRKNSVKRSITSPRTKISLGSATV